MTFPARTLLTLALLFTPATAQTAPGTPPASSPPLTSPAQTTATPAPTEPTPATPASPVPVVSPTPATSSPATPPVSPPTTSGTVTPVQVEDRLVLVASAMLRYTFDPLSGVLTIPNFTLSGQTTLPLTTEWKQRGPDLLLTLSPGTRYSLSPDGKQLTLTPPAQVALPQDAREPLIFPLANADPTVVAGLLTRLYPSLRVEVDARQRALLVLASAADRDMLTRVVRGLDVERPQVMFEAEILEVNTDRTQSLGLQYDSIFTFKLGEGDVPSLLKMGSITRSPLSLTVGLNALKTNGAAKVLAQPRVTTIDGLEARINSTQTTPIVLPGGANSATSVQNITTGITLKMTPKVAPDGTVESTLSIIVSIPTGTTSQGVPQFSTREATTTVRVKNGEPIAIGGLLESRKIEGVQKVPLLGDLPGLGKLFTTTRTDIHNTDLVIVVTPRLVMTPNQK